MTPRHAALSVVLLSVCLPAQACEPILPLAKLLAGPNLLLTSVVWLCAAVLLKSVSFILLERRLSAPKAFGYMLAGNAVSTVVGIIASLASANGPAIIIAVGLVYALAIKPANRLIAISPWPSIGRLNPNLIALFFAGGIFASAMLFEVARGVQNQNPLAYWILKYGIVLLALGIGFALTTLWEETIIARLANGKDRSASFLPAVTRANYITFGGVFAIAALKMLPQRLQSEGFLVGTALAPLLP
jgi:hypothetical protein